MKIVDVYHVLSRAMYYDIENNKVIDGEEALKLREKLKNVERKGWVDLSHTHKMEVWGNGHKTGVTGNLYEL